jgi:hypothetical protein
MRLPQKTLEKTNMKTEIKNENAKLEALASFLGCEIEELNQTKWGYYGLDSFELGSKEYAIGTDSEADAACAEYIRDTVWAFNSDFIVSECGLHYQLAEVFQSFQHEKCESANYALLGLVNATCGIESFVESAISADGRGHFLSSYDGEENEEGEFFIYRVN